MSETDAVRPTGETGAYQPTSDHLDRNNPPQGSETGARCPWCGSEMRSIPFPTSWAARCTNPKCYAIGPQHRENPFDALAAAARPREQLGPRMPWSDMSGSEKEAVYNNAARPLPDFPAGAAGQSMVEEFHRAFGVPVGDTPAIREGQLRTSLIMEEAGEFAEAVIQDDLPSAIDSICDLLYVIYGAAVTFGVNIAPFFEEVHRANMRKVGGPMREDGKILKPDGWTPPDIEGLLSRVNNAPDRPAPDRPAAAGLTLSDADRYECEEIARDRWCYSGTAEEARVGKCTVSMVAAIEGLSAALDRAQAILSSRATGAEVEIPTPEGRDHMQIMGNSPPHLWTEREQAIYSRTIEYARRHATIRGGGE